MVLPSENLGLFFRRQTRAQLLERVLIVRLAIVKRPVVVLQAHSGRGFFFFLLLCNVMFICCEPASQIGAADQTTALKWSSAYLVPKRALFSGCLLACYSTGKVVESGEERGAMVKAHHRQRFSGPGEGQMLDRAPDPHA